ncbi:glutamine--tRNA ligase/YqeY domain fusion protein [Kerstersia gyiorum]|uniref:glutamine--tRNA ligase/YqeY domain fusion protein n=1 Tax=Kerstersia gyiorum TaxID=206506 RepID=UPI00209D46FB|nr:glutamine--tRNA ligase/YqeY domain fusion protein [Kerstersia gyiorum]MCP1633964.1 glutaminyl-tRNA synthetase [Kerstersia gyiorum]MCP1671831.1 glutaminyl-tRNA synthetase [Kerstersia gyiorum]MCP1679836.1 glutaminyl-tRNA synthetase [Kerstersia gyiorum]MCP1683270.1 glutaminyl-tRNA synthetase [Kerstersia gyiorum]MCP1709899.1 glutaminyl-tRNA synthetase [Kerstersia gyiorum]
MSQVPPVAPVSNFIRQIIESDLAADRFRGKLWAGAPGPASVQAQGQQDPARIRTRFPPEPNGYLHIGHAKSICLNFGLARDYGGVCHLRFDDTNPEKENQEYVDAIKDTVHWLGFDWQAESGENHLYFASDYFDYMYGFAEALIEAGYAYVDEQSAEEIRANRGSLTEPGTDSPWRDRPAAESLQRLREMRDGKHPDGSLVLRARIDMASPNINLRDPVLYRVRHAHHHRTGDKWCIYPMYTWAHPVEDALEGITHSICTLEFEDQRPFYDWILARLAELGQLAEPLPHQYEFARLNLSYVVTSKRKLLKLVQDGLVEGWDDPRMPTLVGLRRRGYTPSAIRLFCERIGVARADSRIDYSLLEQALRDDLDPVAERAVAVLDPIKLIITNYPEGQTEPCHAPRNPHDPAAGQRHFPFSRELWIERDDFREEAPKKYFRLFPGNMVRLKYGYVVKCTGFSKDANGNITEVHAEYLPDTKSGTSGADSVKVKGNITWVSAAHAVPAEIRLYDRLFSDAFPDAGDKEFLDFLNPDSIKVVRGWLEPGLQAEPGRAWQFERMGYFAADRELSRVDAPVINRITTLRDSWAQA